MIERASHTQYRPIKNVLLKLNNASRQKHITYLHPPELSQGWNLILVESKQTTEAKRKQSNRIICQTRKEIFS
jgi:hypothetical protein